MNGISKTVIISGFVSLAITLSVAVPLYYMAEDNAQKRIDQDVARALSDYLAQQRYEELTAEERDDVETGLSLDADGFQIVNSTISPSPMDSVSITDSATVKKYDKNGTLIESREG